MTDDDTRPPTESSRLPAEEHQRGYFPWCLAEWDPANATTPTPHPGGYGPVPLGGQNGYLLTDDGGHLAGCAHDLDAVALYLARHRRNRHTAQSYRKEVERFLLWLGLERGRAVSEAHPEDITLYDDLLRHPQRWGHWYADTRRPRSDPQWRPFHGVLSAKARHYALAVVSRLYNWLIEQGYLRLNPVKASAAEIESPSKLARQERYLNAQLWQILIQGIETMPVRTVRQRARYERVRWVIRALYTLLARASEFADSTQGAIYAVERPEGRQWWWTVRGKHRRRHDPPDHVPLPHALVEDLARYRQHLGLSPYPSPGEMTPMIVSLYPQRDGWQPVTRRTVYRIVKDAGEHAAQQLEAKGDHQRAELLRRASTHWLRHTGITHRVDAGINFHELQRLSRLKTVEMLRTYTHAEDDRLSAIAESFGVGGLGTSD
ncbi:MAG: tyrosine-type recombinase/integrase [Halorhodospira sp.]